MPEINQCLVIGCNGQFGSIFVKKLSQEGIIVFGADLQGTCTQPETAQFLEKYIQFDLNQPNNNAKELLLVCDCVVLCIPEVVVLNGLPFLFERLPPDSLVVDIASVKTRVVESASIYNSGAGYLSIHPMFGPILDFSSRNICIIPVRENAKSHAFLELLEKWMANLISLSAEDHDRYTAYIQTLVHTSILAFSSALSKSGLSLDILWRLSTPIHISLMALAARMVYSPPEIYWSIQKDNPYSDAARKELLESTKKFLEGVSENDIHYFTDIFNSVSDYVNPISTDLLTIATSIVDVAKKA